MTTQTADGMTTKRKEEEGKEERGQTIVVIKKIAILFLQCVRAQTNMVF